MLRQSQFLITTLLIAAGVSGCQSLFAVRPFDSFPPANVADDFQTASWQSSLLDPSDDVWALHENPSQALERTSYKYEWTRPKSVFSTTPFDDHRKSPGYSGATSDSLPGWNAAILLAETDDELPQALLQTLERIVAEPLRYDVETLKEVKASSDDRTPETNPTVQAFKQKFGFNADIDQKPKSSENQRLSKEIPPVMRAAAAQVWCQALLKSNGEDPQVALAPAGYLLRDHDLPLAVREELFFSLAQHVPPNNIPRLGDHLRDSAGSERAPTALRRSAVRSCLIYAMVLRAKQAERAQFSDAKSSFGEDDTLWPDTIWNCSWDPDPQVRQAFGRWLAVANPPRSLEILEAQLQDREPSVREQAMLSLGLLGTNEARNILERQAERPEITVRQNAIQGLAFWGPEALAHYVRDPSLHVRKIVAIELVHFAKPAAAMLIRDLLSDPAPQVQSAALASANEWPEELKIPLLLHGLRESCLSVRRDCLTRLQSTTEVPVRFPVEADRQRRSKAVTELAQQAGLPTVIMSSLDSGMTRGETIQNEIHSKEIHAALEAMRLQPQDSPRHKQSLELLKQQTSAEVAIIEDYLRENSGAYQVVVLQEVLPELSPAYAALAELKSPLVDVRRSAARKLAEQANRESLSPRMAHYLFEQMRNEQDRLVWQAIMESVMRDGTDEHSRLALVAINSSWPDIRILGCNYVSHHGRPEQATWVIPLLHDPNKSVQLAAIEAAGNCKNTIVVEGTLHADESRSFPGLRPLMTDSDQRIRMATVVALCKLGEMRAMQELIRLTYSDSTSIREQAVRMMGETGRTRFVEQLIRTAWTERDSRVKRSILSSLNLLIPPDEAPLTTVNQQSYDDRIKAWVSWWEERQGRSENSKVDAASSKPVPSNDVALIKSFSQG